MRFSRSMDSHFDLKEPSESLQMRVVLDYAEEGEEMEKDEVDYGEMENGIEPPRTPLSQLEPESQPERAHLLAMVGDGAAASPPHDAPSPRDELADGCDAAEEGEEEGGDRREAVVVKEEAVCLQQQQSGLTTHDD